MTTVKLTVDPHQTPEEEAQLVARVASAIAESTGENVVAFELTKSEDVHVKYGVGDRMGRISRWSA